MPASALLSRWLTHLPELDTQHGAAPPHVKQRMTQRMTQQRERERRRIIEGPILPPLPTELPSAPQPSTSSPSSSSPSSSSSTVPSLGMHPVPPPCSTDRPGAHSPRNTALAATPDLPGSGSGSGDDVDLERQTLLNDPSPPSAHTTSKSKRAVVWCNHGDCCGIICVIVTWLLIMWPGYIMYTRVLKPWTSVWLESYWGMAALCFYLCLATLAVIAHTRAMLTDPGSIPYGCLPIEPPPPSGLYPTCVQCAYNYKPPRAHHCSTCRRCISRMDHHCPWVNNCVGIGNLKYFLQFCVYIFLLSTFMGSFVMTRILSCPHSSMSTCFDATLVQYEMLHEGRRPPSSIREDGAWSFVLIIMLLMECLVFALFTFAMSVSQIQAISSNETQLEAWQRERDEYKRRRTQRETTRQVVIPIASGGSGNATLSPSQSVSVSMPVAEPLPASSVSCSRNCRVVFMGSGSGSIGGGGSSFHARMDWWNRLRSASSSNPLYFVLRLLLCIPAVCMSLLSSVSWLHYILPTTVVHDDYARLCNYRMPDDHPIMTSDHGDAHGHGHGHGRAQPIPANHAGHAHESMSSQRDMQGSQKSEEDGFARNDSDADQYLSDV